MNRAERRAAGMVNIKDFRPEIPSLLFACTTLNEIPTEEGEENLLQLCANRVLIPFVKLRSARSMAHALGDYGWDVIHTTTPSGDPVFMVICPACAKSEFAEGEE